MINFKTKLLAFVFILICRTGFSQTAKTIDSLEVQYQACLDKGQLMLGCAKKFYFQMDSLLNIQYKKLRANCNRVQKVNLKEDQLQWLAARDKQFKQNQRQVHKEVKENGYDGTQDEAMILSDRNAMFVKDRVIELINKSPGHFSADKYKSKTYKVSIE